jgi:proline dehydrogenase
MVRSILLWASQNRALAQRLPHWPFARKAVRRFMPGEEVEDALRASEELRQEGIATVIGRLGENITSPAEADDVTHHYLDVLQTIGGLALDTTITVKPTQLGLDIDFEMCVRNLQRIVAQAAALGKVVWIDMEYSTYADRTLALFTRAREQHTNVAICLQAYLHRTPADLEMLLRSTTAIRLVKGAYRESADVAIQKKSDVDAAYMRLANRLIEEAATGREVGSPPAIATHDLQIIGRIAAILRDRDIPNDAFEFQMLYGIQRDYQARLAKQGYKVRTLVSYGTAWFPWYMRRLAERPANVLFLLRNLF